MFYRSRHQLWIALLLAVLVPVTTVGTLFAGNAVSLVGFMRRANNQSPAQAPHEEEETHSHAVVMERKGIGRKRRTLTFHLRTCLLAEFLAPDTRQSRIWDRPQDFSLPSTLFLDGALAYRGPPAA